MPTGEGPRPTLPREIDNAKDALVDASSRPLRSPEQQLPLTLYHFTDATGLVGVVRNRALWASLATGLNDQSEIEYGLSVATSILGHVEASQSFVERVQHYLAPGSDLHGAELESHTFVISFCERADLSVHWLHYGRSGSGFALGFDALKLPISGALELRRVVYDPTAQQVLLTSIVDSVWQCFEGLPDQHQHVLFDVAAHTTAVHIKLASVMLKDPCFANEQEWRLVTFDPGPSVDITTYGGKDFPLRFRTVGSRVVPYYEVTYEQLPLKELLVGFSVPMSTSDPGLLLLLQRSGFDLIVPQRSPVPVRP